MEPSDNINLPLDNNLTSHHLDNGLTYYIYKNNSEKSILALAVKVGCVVEEDEQRGIAHFVEHMCLVKELGREAADQPKYHINSRGYTNFDETVYILECSPIREEMERGISILKEIASGSAIKPEHLEAVRKVIISEYEETSQKTDFKVRKTVLPQILNDSFYSKLMPIGELEYINSFTLDSVQEFHREWYRPELMAVIAVGNFEAGMMESLIIDNYAGLKNQENATQRIFHLIPAYKNKKYAVNYFDYLEYSEVSLYCMYPRREICTTDDMKVKIAEYMSYSMTEGLLRQGFAKENLVIMDVTCTKGHFLNQYEFSVVSVKTNNDMVQVLAALMERLAEVTIERCPEYELQECKDTFKKGFKASCEDSGAGKPGVLFNECLQNFLVNELVCSLEYEYELGLNLIDQITISDIMSCQQRWIENQNAIIVINLPDSQKNLTESTVINDYLNALGYLAWDTCSGLELQP